MRGAPIPSSAQSQVIIIVGNGQPYYPPPYPHPYPYDHHVVYGGHYSGYGYYPHPHPYPYPHHHPVVSGGYYPEYGYSNGEGEATALLSLGVLPEKFNSIERV